MTGYAQSDVGSIRHLILKHARDAFVDSEAIDEQWHDLNYLGRPDIERAVLEFERFVALLREFDIEIDFLPTDDRVGLDSIYVRDASIVCNNGMILCNMGKSQRRAEPTVQEAAFRSLGLPIVGAVSGTGTVEGGDVAWISERCLAVGRGPRTNDDGIRQLKGLLGDCVDEVVVVALPDCSVPGDVFHLMSIFSPIDADLALVYPPLLPDPLRRELLGRGFDLVEVPDQEFATMGCNVLAVAPRKCIMLDGNPVTRARLREAGADVFTFAGQEISAKGAGGPTCLTRPIVREIGG
jgi:N-dimethylarginine dimethylaminohydrolase